MLLSPSLVNHKAPSDPDTMEVASLMLGSE